MTLDSYIERNGFGYPLNDDAFDDFCDIIASKEYFEQTLEDDCLIAKLINYVNGRQNNSDVAIDYLANSDYEPISLAFQYVKSTGYRMDLKVLFNPYIGVDAVRHNAKDCYKAMYKSHERQSRIIEDRWKGFEVSDGNIMDKLTALAH